MEFSEIGALISLILIWCCLIVAFVCAIIYGSRRNDRANDWYNKLDEHDKAVINDWKEVNRLLSRDLKKKEKVNNESK